jgi:hypothetical protein
MLERATSTSCTAEVLRFPARRTSCIWITHQHEDGAWLVLAGCHGWAHGDYDAALADANWLACNLNAPIRSAAA